jgi:hypothetical protein
MDYDTDELRAFHSIGDVPQEPRYTYRDRSGVIYDIQAVDDDTVRLMLQGYDADAERDFNRAALVDLRGPDGLQIRDPLVGQRELLDRDARIALHELDGHASFTDLDAHQLATLTDRYQPAVDAFPACEAHELRRIQRDRADALTRRELAAARAAEAREQRTQLPRRARAARRALAAQAKVQRVAAARAQRDLDALQGREREIRDSGHHPRQWVTDHGRDANEWAHAQRGLDRARARDIDAAVAAAVADPPEHARRTLGERTGDPAALQRYDRLAGDLERHRRTPGDHGFERPDTSPLVGRIRASRTERGLQPDPPDVELSVDTVDVGVDV